MAAFGYDRATIAISPEVASSHVDAWEMLAETGTWWTAHDRLAIASRARAGFSQRSKPPWSRDLDDSDSPRTLAPETAAIVDKITLDAGGVDADWASEAISTLGDGAYVELVAIVATVVMIDVFAEAAGLEPSPLPDPAGGDEPSRERPNGLGDIGAHVVALDPFPAANVARALSLVPRANEMFRTVSVPTYSAPGFADLEWSTALSRPQVELIASRVASMNSCFY